MRIAVLIIGLLLGAVMFLQTVLVSGLSDAANDEASAQSGAVGVFMSLLWLAACAFVIPFPMISVVVFALAGVLGFAASGDFPDLAIWGGISLVLAVLSLLGWRGKRRDRREADAERQRQVERDERMEALLRGQTATASAGIAAAPSTWIPAPTSTAPVTFPTFCASCKSRLDPGAKFCMECGTPVASSENMA
jgi:hypothetical protein